MDLELNKDNFETEVLQCKIPVMVDFWGPQCRPCLALMPSIEKIQVKYDNQIKIAKVNTAGGNRILCAKLRVMSLPSFLFYKNGAEVKRLTGEQITAKDIEESIRNVIG
jgi:thioredoxin 1